nr:uncharacterized protein LOC124214436 [Neodiprion pinetum]
MSYGALVLEVEIHQFHQVADLERRSHGALIPKVEFHQVADLEHRNCGALYLEVEFHQVALVLEVEFDKVADLERRNYGALVQKVDMHEEADPERRIQETRNTHFIFSADSRLERLGLSTVSR